MKETILKTDLGREFFADEGCFITEVANIPDDPDVSIARARVAPGITTKWHRLHGTCERYVILAGEGEVEIGDLPRQKITAGDVVLIPPMCHQRISNTGRTDLIFLCVCSPRFRPEVYEDIDK